eukprot:g23625.t1
MLGNSLSVVALVGIFSLAFAAIRPDYSKLCRNPSSYQPNALYNKDNDVDCDSALYELMPQGVYVEMCEVPEMPARLEMASQRCCSDGASLCRPDYARLCSDPTTYDGLRQANSDKLTCDMLMADLTMGHDISAWDCHTLPQDMKASLQVVASLCCGAGFSFCHRDYSGVCMESTQYTGHGKCHALIETYLSPLQMRPSQLDCTNSLHMEFLHSVSGCCSDGKHRCWQDWSSVCTSGRVVRDKLVDVIGKPDTKVQCEQAFEAFAVDYGLHPDQLDCKALSDDVRAVLDHVSADCCDDGVFVCHRDFSGICKSPAGYTPHHVPGLGTYPTATCDQGLASFFEDQLESLDLKQLDCSNALVKQAVDTFAPRCCVEGIGRCEVTQDFAKLCEDPSTYQATGMGVVDITEAVGMLMQCDLFMQAFVNKYSIDVNNFDCSSANAFLLEELDYIADGCCGKGGSICSTTANGDAGVATELSSASLSAETTSTGEPSSSISATGGLTEGPSTSTSAPTSASATTTTTASTSTTTSTTSTTTSSTSGNVQSVSTKSYVPEDVCQNKLGCSDCLYHEIHVNADSLTMGCMWCNGKCKAVTDGFNFPFQVKLAIEKFNHVCDTHLDWLTVKEARMDKARSYCEMEIEEWHSGSPSSLPGAWWRVATLSLVSVLLQYAMF